MFKLSETGPKRAVSSLLFVAFLLFVFMPPVTVGADPAPPDLSFETGLGGFTSHLAVTNTAGEPVMVPVDDDDIGEWTVSPKDSQMAVLRPGTPNKFFAEISNLLELSEDSISYITTNFASTTNFSYIYAAVELEANQTISMGWNYVSVDYVPFNDGSFVSFVNRNDPTDLPLINGVRAEVGILGATVPGTGNYSTGSYGSTGWQTVTLKASSAGEYLLGFAVFNLDDTALSPFLFVDDGPGTTLKNGDDFGAIPPDENAPPPAGEVTEFSVTYYANGSDGGTVPVDGNTYTEGTSVTVLGNTGNLEKEDLVFTGWNTAANGSGTYYAADSSITVGTTNIKLYAVFAAPPAAGEEPGEDPGLVPVIVNGTPEKLGSAQTTTGADGTTVTTVTLNGDMLSDSLNNAGNGAVLTIPVAHASDTVTGVLNGQMVKDLETKQAILEITTPSASYTLPASQIDIDAVSAQFGTNVTLSSIEVQIEIRTPPADTVRVVETAAESGSFAIMVPPVEFTVSCVYNGNKAEVTSFNSYVERTVAIPDGVDPSKITTGIVIEPDGTVRHVPTHVFQVDGRYYAKINSLTNSTYSVIWNPVVYADAYGHWAQDSINNMASRMVVSGVGTDLYAPDQAVTRSDFVVSLVKALGLKPDAGDYPFTDVPETYWYRPYLETAVSYGLLDVSEDGLFRPKDPVTREDAIAMMARAAELAGYNTDVSDKEKSELFKPFVDIKANERYANEIAVMLKYGIFLGKSAGRLALLDHLTRAEAAAVLERFLEYAELI